MKENIDREEQEKKDSLKTKKVEKPKEVKVVDYEAVDNGSNDDDDDDNDDMFLDEEEDEKEAEMAEK